jgi:hypothetical protein
MIDRYLMTEMGEGVVVDTMNKYRNRKENSYMYV